MSGNNTLAMKGYCELMFQGSLQAGLPGSGHAVALLSETLSEEIGQLERPLIADDYREWDSERGLRSIGGDLVMELDPWTIGTGLKAVFGACTTTSGTPTANDKTHVFSEQNSYHAEGVPLEPFAVRMGRQTGSQYVYEDQFGNQLALNWANGEFVKGTISAIGGHLINSFDTESAPTYPTKAYTPPANWSQVSLSIFGATPNQVRSIDFTMNNQLEAVPTLNNKDYATWADRTGPRQVRVNMTVRVGPAFFSSLHASYLSNSGMAVSINTKFDANGQRLLISVPEFRIDTWPHNMGGPGPQELSLSGRGLFNVGLGYAALATLVNHSFDLSTYGNGAVS